MKRCSKCKELKETSEFGVESKRKDGLYPQCKPCARAAKKATRANASPEQKAIWRAQINQWRIDNPDKVRVHDRRHKLKKFFGMTEEEYNELLIKQNGACAICRKTSEGKALAVDHCHETNKVRGLLCSNCNTALGLLGDDVTLMQKGIEYLEDSRI